MLGSPTRSLGSGLLPVNVMSGMTLVYIYILSVHILSVLIAAIHIYIATLCFRASYHLSNLFYSLQVNVFLRIYISLEQGGEKQVLREVDLIITYCFCLYLF